MPDLATPVGDAPGYRAAGRIRAPELYLEGRAASIAGGSDEIQRNVIAKHVLRL